MGTLGEDKLLAGFTLTLTSQPEPHDTVITHVADSAGTVRL